MAGTNPFIIDDLLCNDPFESVFERIRDSIFYEYMSYRDYFNFLKIIESRLKDSYRKYGEIQPAVTRIMESYIVSNHQNDMIIRTQSEIMTKIQLDQESFIVFSQILLNKLGILVEKLVNARSESNYAHSFSKHKEWFIKNNINPRYSQILKQLHWYDQFLNFMRNKIIEHGSALSPMVTTTRYGIRYHRKKQTFGVLSDKDQMNLRMLIQKYGLNDEKIRNINPNPYMMLDEFVEVVLENNIELETDDLRKLGEIVKNSGCILDAVLLAKHLTKFLNDVAALF